MAEMKQNGSVSFEGSKPLDETTQLELREGDMTYPTREDIELLQIEESRVDTEEQTTVDNILLELRALREAMGATIPLSPVNSLAPDVFANTTMGNSDKVQADHETSVTAVKLTLAPKDVKIKIGDAVVSNLSSPPRGHPTDSQTIDRNDSQTIDGNDSQTKGASVQIQKPKSAFSTGKNFLPVLLPEDYNRLLSGLASANSVSMRAELLYTTLTDVALYSHQLANIFKILKLPAEKISVARLVRDTIADPHRCCACVLPVLGGETISTCNRVLVALNLA
eukprot:m.192265 g.192265  ORF g.192265 m.192265 type:complete len:280 (+) comp32458_c1_seq2:329-1168(+)